MRDDLWLILVGDAGGMRRLFQLDADPVVSLHADPPLLWLGGPSAPHFQPLALAGWKRCQLPPVIFAPALDRAEIRYPMGWLALEYPLLVVGRDLLHAHRLLAALADACPCGLFKVAAELEEED